MRTTCKQKSILKGYKVSVRKKHTPNKQLFTWLNSVCPQKKRPIRGPFPEVKKKSGMIEVKMAAKLLNVLFENRVSVHAILY